MHEYMALNPVRNESRLEHILRNVNQIPKYKTQICKHFCQGKCKLLQSCVFAHGLQEQNLVAELSQNSQKCQSFFKYFQSQWSKMIVDLNQIMIKSISLIK